MMPPTWLNATRWSTASVYAARLCLNTPTVMSLHATNSVILGEYKEVSNKFLLALSITLPRGFPTVDLRRSSTTMGCLTGRGDGIQCSHHQRFDGPHGPVELTFHREATRDNMEPIWLSHYPAGIPAEVNLHEFASLRDLLLRSCERFGSLPAFSNMGASITYAELDRSSRNFAAYLQKTLGLHKGDRVAIMMPNLLQYPVALFGVLRAGLVVVSVNPQYTPPELEHQLKDSGAVAIVVLENFAHALQEVLDNNPTLNPVVITTEVGDMFPLVKALLTNVVVKYVKHMVPAWKFSGSSTFNAALRAGRGQELEDVPLNHNDTAFLQYTGGTTGVAKSAVLTHGNLVANVQQLGAWMARDLVDGKEVFVCPLPLYHVYAL